MKEWFSKLFEEVRHYKWTTVGIVLSLSILMWVYGCQTELTSPISEEPVTQSEFNLEVEQEVERLQNEAERLELVATNMNKKFEQVDQIKNSLFNALVVVAEGGAVNPLGVLVSVAGVLGLGHYADNREKDRLLAGAKRLSIGSKKKS